MAILFLLHALGGLPGDVNELKHLQVGLEHVEMLVQAAPVAPLRHNGKVVFCHVAHEQQDVDMSGLPVAR